jgi:hypothetical protein
MTAPDLPDEYQNPVKISGLYLQPEAGRLRRITNTSPTKKSPDQPPSRTTKVLVFELINAETRVPNGIAGLFLAGDISGIGPGGRRSKQTASQSLALRAANQRQLLP